MVDESLGDAHDREMWTMRMTRPHWLGSVLLVIVGLAAGATVCTSVASVARAARVLLARRSIHEGMTTVGVAVP